MDKQEFPMWFSPHCPPHNYAEPQKTIMVRENIGDAIVIDDGDEIHLRMFNPAKRYCFDIEMGYREEPDVFRFIEFEERVVTNPSYEEQLAKYKEWESRAKDWPRLKKQWDHESTERTKEKEKKLYLKLQKKYGKSM